MPTTGGISPAGAVILVGLTLTTKDKGCENEDNRFLLRTNLAGMETPGYIFFLIGICSLLLALQTTLWFASCV